MATIADCWMTDKNSLAETREMVHAYLSVEPRPLTMRAISARTNIPVRRLQVVLRDPMFRRVSGRWRCART